ncbi:MAG: hypothetical protein LBS00_01455 [Synergistaceae bacterium]|jgi:hypothetical protein|nr:hypothetical protein [Synergistaceae bacterium]
MKKIVNAVAVVLLAAALASGAASETAPGYARVESGEISCLREGVKMVLDMTIAGLAAGSAIAAPTPLNVLITARSALNLAESSTALIECPHDQKVQAEQLKEQEQASKKTSKR